MADSDFLSYSSIYESFSKGPKSIYYGVGDEMLPGAILNVPQTDEDDEWGRTQRIADERAYDFIAKIYKTLFDPYNSLADISLVPGEAGSEINVAKNVIRLVGRSGIDVGVFDLTVPSMTLGDVVINGTDNSILIGSGFEATETSLKLNTDYIANSDTSYGDLTYRRVSAQLYDDNASTYTFTISIDSQNYVFGSSGLSLPVGATISASGMTLSGDLNTYNIYPVTTDLYDIGSSVLKYKNIYAKQLTTNDGVYSTDPANWVISGPNLTIENSITLTTMMSLTYQSVTINIPTFTQNLLPSVTETSDIGSPVLKYNSIYAKQLTTNDGVYSTDPASWVISGPNLTIENSITSTTMMSLTYQSVTLNILTFTQSLLPSVTEISDIGSSSLKYNSIYANYITSEYGLFSNRTSFWYLCGPNMRIYNTTLGSTVMGIDSNEIDARLQLVTRDIFPNTTEDYDIGSASLSYNSIYTRQVISEQGLFSNASSQWSICGPNLKIRVGGDSKIGVCATYIEMYEDLYTNSIFPIAPTGSSLGHSSGGGFEALYLRDQVTGIPVKIYVCAGVLYP